KTPIVQCRFGFGRALILRTMPSWDQNSKFRDIDERDWVRAVCFVWNVRDDQANAILNRGGWISPIPDEETADALPFQPVEFSRASALRQVLFPHAVRVMPFGVVVTILGLFLLAVAPGDYFLHGVLRRRWMGWMAFPTTCLLFTGITVWIAETYTGRVDHR